ncbi:MAG TPA: TatD family hydrolase [Rectinemataceae bacterium]|nr:TatD family hydrolase [Rectinemataceae bacterium]
MIYTDTHAHLSLVAEELGFAAVSALLLDYEAAWSAGGAAHALILDPGVEADDLPKRRSLLGDRPFLRYAAGIWPSEEALAEPASQLKRLAAALDAGAAAGVAAIGECGLDYHHMNGPAAAQRELFEAQIELAERRGLPLIVHSRDAAADTLAILGARKPRIPVVLHCYGYGPGELEDFLALGCYISFAGNLSYKSARPLREACALVPGGRLLLETDAPYMNPEPRRGRPSTSADVERTYAVAAALRSTSVEELAATVSANAHSLFGTL